MASEIRRDGPGEGYKSFRVKTRRGGKSGTAPSPACKVLRKLVTAAIATASRICGSLNPCACKGIGSNPVCNPVGQQVMIDRGEGKAPPGEVVGVVGNSRHDSLALLRQLIYQTVAGYEDANEC